MLYYKAWLELRYRVLAATAAAAFTGWQAANGRLITAAQDPQAAPFLDPALRNALVSHSYAFNAIWLTACYHMLPVLLTLLGVAFASAGVKTQVMGARDNHPSMYFTLSLPVTRRRLLFVRSISGFAAILFLALVMIAVSAIVTHQAPTPELLYILLPSLCGASVFYAVSTLLSVYLSDLWQIYAGYAIFGAYMFQYSKVEQPRLLDLFRLMNGELYVTSGHLPFSTLALALALSGALFTATLWCMRRREF